jgi:capsular polysaccharide biosynthesis protein
MNLSTRETALLQQGILVVTGNEQGLGTQPASELFSLLRSRWLLIVIVSLVGALGSVVYCLLTPKWYRAQLLMEVVQPETGGSNLSSVAGGLGGIAALAGFDLAGNDILKKEFVAKIGSRAFTYRFMNDEGIIPILFADKWDATNQRWKSAADQPSLEKAYKLFNSGVRAITEDRRNGLIRVTVDWKDPVLAMNWANKLVAQFNADAREIARDDARRSLEFLDRELAHTDIVDLRTTINGLIESETRKSMLASVREQYAFKIIDPAFLPGKEGIVWPRPALLTAVALMVGAIVGGLLALVLGPRASKGG